jgi:formiminotetrahydrofolate cyclodeaminase
VGVVRLAKAALTGASLNIFINTKLMKDREYAEALNSEAAELMNTYAPMAEKIFDSVLDKLR